MDNTRPLSIIPALKPPSQDKSKSLMVTMDQANALLMSSSKMQNSWEPKSTNVQKSQFQNDQCVSESATEAIVNQIWQQTQTLSQQPNTCLTNLAANQMLMPISQPNINRLQETASNVFDSNPNDQNQFSSCNVTKATLIQSQACLTNQNYSQNMLHVNQDNINLLEATSDNITINKNETQYRPCNVVKTVFDQTQICSSNNQSYLQNSLSVDQGVLNLQQIAVSNVSSNAKNYSQSDAANISRTNQTQTCLLTDESQTYLHNTGFNLLEMTANHVSDKSEFSQHGHCNISKAATNQAQLYSLSNQNYLPSVTSNLHLGDLALPQTCLKNVPISSSTSNSHGITHIQNDLQQSQHLKPATFLSEQVYAELKQTVCNLHNYIEWSTL